MTTETVPPRVTIEFTEHAFARALERLGHDEAAVRFEAPRAKRVDHYKDGLRLWRIEGGWLGVHEVMVAGTLVKAVVITALDDSMTAGWRPASAPRPVRVHQRPRPGVNRHGRGLVSRA